MEEDDDSKLSRAEQEARFMELMEEFSPNEQADFLQLMRWMAQRPKDAEPLTFEKMTELLNDIRLENIRRRLGGKVGEILPFKKPESKH